MRGLPCTWIGLRLRGTGLLSLTNGVFDVEVVDGDTILRPRGIHPDMFAEGTTFTMAEVRDAIGPDDEAGPVGSTQ